jgi:hypothetical protein
MSGSQSPKIRSEDRRAKLSGRPHLNTYGSESDMTGLLDKQRFEEMYRSKETHLKGTILSSTKLRLPKKAQTPFKKAERQPCEGIRKSLIGHDRRA